MQIQVWESKVKKGRGRGKILGFPTINLKIPLNLNLFFGVYFCFCYTSKGRKKGILHFGPRETFGLKKPSLEIHLLDFKGSLRGEEVKVEILRKIRAVKKFESEKELKTQIQKDVEKAQNFFNYL